MTFCLFHTNSILDIHPCWLAVFTPEKYCWHSTVFQMSVTPFSSRSGHILLLEVLTTHHCFFIDLQVTQFFATRWYLRKKHPHSSDESRKYWKLVDVLHADTAAITYDKFEAWISSNLSYPFSSQLLVFGK